MNPILVQLLLGLAAVVVGVGAQLLLLRDVKRAQFALRWALSDLAEVERDKAELHVIARGALRAADEAVATAKEAQRQAELGKRPFNVAEAEAFFRYRQLMDDARLLYEQEIAGIRTTEEKGLVERARERWIKRGATSKTAAREAADTLTER